MSDDPLRVLTSVPLAALPILDALRRLHRDAGSVSARKVAGSEPPPPEGLRLICVACVDALDVEKLGRDLARELRDDPASAVIASRVKVISFQDGLFVVVFRDMPCIRAEGEET